MEIRYASSNKDAKHYDTARLREEYLIQDLFTPNNIKLVWKFVMLQVTKMQNIMILQD